MSKYEDYNINQKQISTAIFEYLEKRDKIPNRKEGIKYNTKWGNLTAWIKVQK
jgi:hypothetical protein